MSTDLTKFPKFLILLLLCTFASFVGLLFTPALPELGRDFGVSSSVAARTMSVFLIGYAVGQLPYGPLSNRFGRKQAITIGALIALTGMLLSYFSTSFNLLCLARFIQAIGASVGLKVAFTIIADGHSGRQAAKATSTLSAAFGFMPGLATTLGGFITVYAGWRNCFLVLSIYTVILWLLTRFLPETARELDRDALQIKRLRSGYKRQFKDLYLVLHALLAGLSSASIYVFATISPYLAIEKIGLAPDVFGLWAFVPSLGLFSGALVGRRISDKNPRVIILSGTLLFLLAVLVLSIFFANGIVNPWTLFIPTFFIYMGNNLVWSSSLSHGLSGATDKSNASAVFQFVNLCVATLAVFLSESVSSTAMMLLPTIFGILILFSFMIWLRLKAQHANRIT